MGAATGVGADRAAQTDRARVARVRGRCGACASPTSILMKPDSNSVRAVAPDHASYWRDLRLPDYVGGPLADRSGGLITFSAGSIEEAELLVAGDPFVRANVLDGSWLKEWAPSGGEYTGQDLRTAGTGSPGP